MCEKKNAAESLRATRASLSEVSVAEWILVASLCILDENNSNDGVETMRTLTQVTRLVRWSSDIAENRNRRAANNDAMASIGRVYVCVIIFNPQLTAN